LLDKVFAAKVVYSKKYDLGFGQVTAADEDEANTEEIEESKDEKEKFEIVDLHRPLEGDCTLELLDFDDPHGKSTFFHSSAHILGNIIEYHYGAHLCIGPPLK
jgi:threonyl-tRNA synthetase